MDTLLKLFSEEALLAVHFRTSSARWFHYYIWGAFAEGFGGVAQYPDGMLRGKQDNWDAYFAEGGCNLREAQKQVNHLMEEVISGKHDGCKVWGLADNGIWFTVWC